MLGSAFEAEDAVQETFIRAWRGLRPLRGAGGAALLALPHRDERLPRHARLPRAARPADGPRPGPRAGRVEPAHAARGDVDRADADGLVVPEGDPAEVAVARETVQLAFVAALQHLPPRQRAVLDPLRGAPLAGHRGRPSCSRRASRRSTARCSARGRRSRRREARVSASARRARRGRSASCSSVTSQAFEALRHRRAHVADPGGRDPVDAAVRPLAAAAATTSSRGGSAPASAAAARGSCRRCRRTARRRSASTSPRPAAATSRGRCRCSRSRTGAIVELTFFLDTESRVPALRPPGAPRRVAAAARRSVRQDVVQPHQPDERAELRRGVAEVYAAAEPARRELQPRERVDRRPRPARRPRRRRARSRRRSRVSSAQTRSQSPPRSACVIGPRIANAIVCGAAAVILGILTLRRAETHRRRDDEFPQRRPV